MKLKPGMREKPNGSIEYRFVIDGKRYSVTAKSIRELNQKEQDLRMKIALGDPKRASLLKLDDYFVKWQAEKRTTQKASTIRVYETIYKNHVKKALGSKPMGDIQKEEILELMTGAKTPYTANRILKLITAVMNDAVRDDVIDKSPSQNIRRMREPASVAVNTTHRALTIEEQKLLMQELKSEWLYEVFALMLATGMRGGEACGLQWDDINSNVIHVKRTASTNEAGKLIYGPPKTSSSERDIPMNETIRSIIEAQKIKHDSMDAKSPFVFLSLRGLSLYTRALADPLERAVKRLNAKGIDMPKIASHALRDTFATRFIEAGGSMHTLKTLMGHATLAMTMDLYAHVLPNTKQEEMDRIHIEV